MSFFFLISNILFFSSSVLKVATADQFYSAMAHLSVQLLDEKIIDADNLIKVNKFCKAKTNIFVFFFD
jgi:hypothetical protein